MEIKALVLTNKGLENISSNEIQKLIGVENFETLLGKVFFKCSQDDLVKLTYLGRTFNRVIQVLADYKFSGREEILGKLPDVASFTDGSFNVECEREGQHKDFTSFELSQALNAKICDKTGNEIKHKNPNTYFSALVIEDRFVFGLDYSGRDLGKRDYRIFLGRDSLKGNIAASMLDVAGYESKDILLDPFCRHGVIPIEAALMATNTSVNFFSKDKLAFNMFVEVDLEKYDESKELDGKIVSVDAHFAHVSAARKNAKIAGIVRQIQFSRKELEWLDTKFGEKAVDKIVTMPLQPSAANEGRIKVVYDKMFERFSFILKDGGVVVLCMKQKEDIPKEHAKKHGFVLSSELAVMQGKEELKLLKFSKG